jgi:tetratricopeptide (TPR) repeat protein
MIGVLAFVCGLAQGKPEDELKTALADGEALYQQNNYAAAQAVFEKVVKDFPAAPAEILAGAHVRIGMSLDRQGKAREGQAAYRKAQETSPSLNAGHLLANSLVNHSRDFEAGRQVAQELLTTYATGKVSMLASVQMQIAKSYALQKDHAASQAAYQEVIRDYPAAPAAILAAAQDAIGKALVAQGKPVEANAAFMTCVSTYVWELGAKDERGVIWQVFGRISPKLATAADYKTFLETTIKATKAVEENAQFLGRLKSELGKMQ